MKKSLLLPLLSSLFLGLASLSGHASVVAIVDSGADIDHPVLSQNIWKNLPEVEAKGLGDDEDANGLVDDFFGFNFMKMNNVLINKDDFALFDNEVQMVFKLQYYYELYQMGHNLFTKELAELFNKKMSDKNLAYKAQLFGGFAHGTHVAGIVAQNNKKLELITLKGLGGGTQSAFKLLSQLVEDNQASVQQAEDKVEEKKIVNLLDDENFRREVQGFATMVGESLTGTVTNALIYSAQKKARVLNASLGAGLENVVPGVVQTFANYGATESDIFEISKMILQSAIRISEENISKIAPNTLMVIAAGNSAMDNDQAIFTPANVNIDNAITVAATFDRHALASFSNYGANSVHVAAPGVGIYSSVPGGDYVHMNGTSQAAPFVTRVASKMVDANQSLTSLQLKNILMGTVDKKDFLKGKVISGGIVNEERAIMAAELSQSVSVEEAIELAKAMVTDVEPIVIAEIKSVHSKALKLNKLKSTAVAFPEL